MESTQGEEKNLETALPPDCFLSKVVTKGDSKNITVTFR
jgi:hypothetical protein